MPAVAAEPLPPKPEHLVVKTGKRRAVARDPVVRRVPSKFLAECLVLLLDRVVAMLTGTIGRSS